MTAGVLLLLLAMALDVFAGGLALGIASLPGQPHGEFPAVLALAAYRRPHLFVEGLLTMKDQQRFTLLHNGSENGN